MSISDPFVILRRYPYEEPYLIHVGFFVSNGLFMGSTEIYFNVEDIAAMGDALKSFPKSVGDEYRYICGSEKPKAHESDYFMLRAYTTNAKGDCALQFAFDWNAQEPHEGSARFSIKAEAASIDRLADLLKKFSRLDHLQLRWTTTDGELLKEYGPVW